MSNINCQCYDYEIGQIVELGNVEGVKDEDKFVILERKYEENNQWYAVERLSDNQIWKEVPSCSICESSVDYNYYELIFQNKIDPCITSSQCVLGYRKPTIQEAKKFWKEDCDLYCDEELSEVIYINRENAYRDYDMNREHEFPIFK